MFTSAFSQLFSVSEFEADRFEVNIGHTQQEGTGCL